MSIRDSPLARVKVREAMHTGILTTDGSTPLRVVARLMADQRVHAVAVSEPGHVRRPWGIVTALDVAAAASSEAEPTAGDAVASEVVTVLASDSLEVAARVMVDQGVSHVVVIDPASGHPAGILSTLDIAAAYAG
jgi:CBS domain-containing protein